MQKYKNVLVKLLTIPVEVPGDFHLVQYYSFDYDAGTDFELY